MKRDKLNRIRHDLKEIAGLKRKLDEEKQRVCNDTNHLFDLIEQTIRTLDKLHSDVENGVKEGK